MPAINPEILTWARESCGLDLETAAKKLQFKDSQASTGAEKLFAYETGKTPSRPLLVKMSKLYKKPLLTFYMGKPPIKGNRGEDFRTLPDGLPPEDSLHIDTLIRDIVARQSLLRETILDEEEAEKLKFIGSETIHQNIQKLSETISKTLNFDLAEFRKNRTIENAFKYLRTKTEDTGIFVLLAGNLGSHHSNIDTNFFRGFALSDDIAPFIVINDQDAKSAWAFTLLHETAHLWLGKTGVSGSFAENRIERFCNDVASNILLPANEIDDFNPDTDDFEELATEITKFATKRNISSGLVSYRLYRKGHIEKGLWHELSRFYKQQWLEFKRMRRDRNKAQEGGPNYYTVRRNKLGDALVKFAERMTESGAITTTKAGLLLGVKPLKVQKLFNVDRAI